MRRRTIAGALPGLRALRLFVLQCLLCGFATAAPAQNGEQQGTPFRVVEPYIEMHSGPGRGFPVFHVVERGAVIHVVKRHTDWFWIREPEGKEGWVARVSLEQTLSAGGEPVRLRDVLLDDYVSRRLEVGMAAGQLEGEPALRFHGTYRLWPWLGAELAYSQASAAFNTARVVEADLLLQPFTHWLLEPYAAVGAGQFSDTPRSTLLDASTSDALAASVGIGIRWHMADRFVARFEFKNFAVGIDDGETKQLQQLTGGLAFFF